MSINRALQSASFVIFAATGMVVAASAQTARPSSAGLSPASRITAAIDNTDRVTLPGTASAHALMANDMGALSGSTPLTGMTLVFSRSTAQQADLDALTTAQQTPGSALYHQWLTPAQFGARFGLSDSDLAAASAWLQSQGFAVLGVSNARDRITFSGTAAQVTAAFGTELHNYRGAADGQVHFAPSTALSVPGALSAAVLTVGNLSSFRPRSYMLSKGPQMARPDFTSSVSGSHFLSPGDVAVIYDVKPVYSAGYTGTGQIAVIGQSNVVLQDIANFQTASGLALKAPNLFIVPNSGTPTVYTGDESESDLDIEYSGAMAPGATIDFVYTGSSTNYGVLDALTYAINTNLAPIVTASYGACEIAFGSSMEAQYESLLQQGAAQGQTVIAASGDDGSSGCYGETTLSTANQQAVSAGYPAASKFVTGMGGTEFPASAVAVGNNTYFTAQSSTDSVTSALSYIPEQVWDDDAVNYQSCVNLGIVGTSSCQPVAAGGGGISIYQARPSWQTGVPGIPTGSFRLVPDISLDASPDYAPFLFCSSDTKATGINNSCSSGFRDGNSTSSTYQNVTAAGGTSFDAPIFAGLLSVLSQAKGYTTGQGLINPTLYSIASNASTYASAFHDITSGSNECLAGTAPNTYCGTAAAGVYVAGTGYDEASGLGSIDFSNLVSAWPKNTVTTPGRAFALSAAAASVTRGTAGTATINVTPANGYSGTVSFQVLAASTADVALYGNSCYSVTNATVGAAASSASASVTIYTNQTTCATGTTALVAKADTTLARVTGPSQQERQPSRRLPVPETLAGLLFVGVVCSRRRKALPSALLAVVLLASGLGALSLTGCSSGTAATPVSGGGGGGTTSAITPAGTYVLTVVGQDTTTSSISANTTLTITVM